MFGAIAGDIIGSYYESHNVKTDRPETLKLFHPQSAFTDDTVMTVAVADALLSMPVSPPLSVTKRREIYINTLRAYGRRYPDRGYGAHFRKWLYAEEFRPYQSFGNGSAMRVSPVGFAFRTLDETLQEARISAEITHDHPEGIKGAQAVAAAVFLARTAKSKEAVRAEVIRRFHYDLSRSVAEIRPGNVFDETCQGTVPQAITCFLESENYEDAVRKAVSIGGDSDTIACITGAIAHAFYTNIPSEILRTVNVILEFPLRQVIASFMKKYSVALGEIRR